jgi:hypothetical protein
MLNKSQPVEIIGVDADTLEKDETFPEAYAFYIKLSDEPDNIWQSYLAKWNKALNAMQRKIDVVGDRLRLVFIYGDNIQNYAKYAAQLVKMVNERVMEHNKKVDSLEKMELWKQEESRRKEEKMRQQLRRLEPEPMSAEMEVTAEELASAYETDEETADARFGNKILKVTGLVNRIEVKDTLDIHYITLGDEKNLLQSVRCMFDKGHEGELNQLTKGQRVTVQGKFDGSIVQLRMRHCVLVR